MKIIKVPEESKSDIFYDEYPSRDEDVSLVHKMSYAEIAKKQERIKWEQKRRHKK